MAKTYSVQIEKAQSLLKGIRMNYDKVSTLGITQTELRNLEHVTVEVDRINKDLILCMLQSARRLQMVAIVL
jgi:hypothetical protein